MVIIYEYESHIRDYQTLRATWSVKGRQKQIPTYGHHATVSLLGGVNIETGEFHCMETNQCDAQAFLQFLQYTLDQYWGSKIYNGLVNFQRNEGIAADVVGPVTWEEFEDYRVYVGYLGSTQYYEWNYNLTDSYPATYLRDACYGWYINVTTNNSEDY
ncbi:transposase [Parageobacillus thermoglucosidasius]|uniref:transposase n=1 Tax=Parageobacillus thermoglucosidasius TaxID=1426 RepID=UPI0027FDA179|nr:hypothetical protein PthstB1num2_37110 [Parageobacillus thermoglucosidasius]